MGDWWRMHNVEIHDLYSSPNVIQVIRSRTIRCEKHVIYIYIHIYIYIYKHTYIHIYRERRGVYRVLVREHDGKKSLGRPNHRQKDHVKRNAEEISW